jgi:hypothetical protein
MKRNILLVVVLLVIAAGAVGIYLYTKQTPDVVQEKPHAAVNAKELIAAFERDTAAARAQFIDKVVEVTGTVKKIDTSGTILLGEEGLSSDVSVGLDRRHLKDHEKLQVGQIAVLQGVCSGYTKAAGNDPNDLLASLGGTVELRSAGVKAKQ